MSLKLQVYRAKPNPAGKDRSAAGPRPEQLVAEWVDIKNVGDAAVQFASMELHHTKYGRSCSEVHGTEAYWKGGGGNQALGPGQILRVHTGSKDYEQTLSAEDRGPDVSWTGYAGRGNFVLNNDCGDTISIFWLSAYSQQLRDSASYAPRPPEGRILVRQGDRLV